MRLLSWAVIVALVGVGVAPVDAWSPPPCGGSTRLATVLRDLFRGASSEGDLGGDAATTAADLVAVAVLGEPPDCPHENAAIDVFVDNRSAARSIAITLRARRTACLCVEGTGRSAFAQSFRCIGNGIVRCGALSGLAPGEWLFELSVDEPERGQVQRRRALLVSESRPRALHWTAYAAVAVVRSAADDGEATLRALVGSASDLPKPLLIRFADDVFPPGVPAMIGIESPMPVLAADDVTIDAFDAHGVAGLRGVDAQGGPFGAFSISGARNRLVGIALRNAGGQNRDVLRVFGARAEGNVVAWTVVENSATGDGIGIDDEAGADLGARATVIRDSVVRGAGDKGIKVTTGAYARIERSWVHENWAGGVQATLGGHISASENLVERNGGVGAENGFAVQGLDAPGALSTLALSGDVSRHNEANGLSVRSFATAVAVDSAFVENGTAGVRVFNDVGAPSLAAFEGTSVTCNSGDGIVVRDESFADLGGGPFGSKGENALAFNGRGGAGVNFRTTVSTSLPARFSQWQRCGPSAVCDVRAIERLDVHAPNGMPAIEPALAPHALEVPTVTSVTPTLARAGEWMRIRGTGFDAIGAWAGADQPGQCAAGAAMTVELAGHRVPVEIVTPTMIVARWPFTCLEPVPLIVSAERLGGRIASDPVIVCRHPDVPVTREDMQGW